MARFGQTYAEAVKNAAHLIALGETDVYLYDDTDFPFDKVTKVESGSTYRLNGPSSCRLIASEAGLSLSISVDFEGRDANGRGVSLFDRDRLRELMLKLAPEARQSFASVLTKEVLPGLQTRTQELRDALRSQADSEDCVRGLIAYAEQVSA